jgi:hypothetical protein
LCDWNWSILLWSAVSVFIYESAVRRALRRGHPLGDNRPLPNEEAVWTRVRAGRGIETHRTKDD